MVLPPDLFPIHPSIHSLIHCFLLFISPSDIASLFNSILLYSIQLSSIPFVFVTYFLFFLDMRDGLSVACSKTDREKLLFDTFSTNFCFTKTDREKLLFDMFSTNFCFTKTDREKLLFDTFSTNRHLTSGSQRLTEKNSYSIRSQLTSNKLLLHKN